jgi:hypothetical protein
MKCRSSVHPLVIGADGLYEPRETLAAWRDERRPIAAFESPADVVGKPGRFSMKGSPLTQTQQSARYRTSSLADSRAPKGVW